MNPTRSLLNGTRLITVCIALACTGLAPGAAAAGVAGEAQARYRQEMGVCNSGRSHQDAPTCRLEARNALAEARRGALVDAPESYQANARQRCRALEGLDRSACESRMQGHGKTDGSVLGGGILRESVTVVPAN